MSQDSGGGLHGSARERLSAELAVLRQRSQVTLRDISDWIELRRSESVSTSTVGDWLGPEATVPRYDKQFLLVVECLYIAASEPWTSRDKAFWKQLRANAYKEPKQSKIDTVRAPEGGCAAVLVGPVPAEPAHFVDREQFKTLRDRLMHGRATVVVTGMRGAGKTQVAAAYAREVLDHDRRGVLVGWVSAEVDTIHDGLAAIADHFGVNADDGDPVKAAHRLRDYLNNHPEPHLLVLDNATDSDLLRPLLPTRGGARIIITTTDQAMTHLADIPDINVTGYTTGQATTFLRAATKITDDPTGEKDLAKELGHLPLGLAAAAAAITARRTPMLYHEYLKKLRSQPLPRALRRREGTDYPRSTDKAIMLSVQAAESATDDPDVDMSVKWLLGLFAALAPTGVRRKMLHHPDRNMDELVDDAIERCVRYSLLTWSTDEDRLVAHRLTTRVLLERARDNGQGNRVLSDALAVVQPHRIDHAQAWTRRVEGADLVDQIEAIWSTGIATRAPSILCNRTVRLRLWATQHLVEAANLDRAIPLAENILTDCCTVLVPNHPYTPTALSNLARAYESAGRLTDAIRLFERAVSDYERVLETDHTDTLCARNNLAHAYASAGRLADAIRWFERAISDYERVLGTDHPDTISARSNLAGAYESAGRLAEAIAMYERTLADRERVLGPDHPSTLTARNNYAFVHRSAGRTKEAISLFESALLDHERVLGSDHPDTLSTRSNLAGAYALAGRFAEATSMYEHALAEHERILGPDHLATLSDRNNLAHTYALAGRVTEAIPLHEAALADHERIIGTDHPYTVGAYNNLAFAYRAAGHLAKAIPMYERTVALGEHVLGPDHPHTLTARKNLAHTYALAGRVTEAIPLHEAALADHERALGTDHSSTLNIRAALDWLRMSQKDSERTDHEA
ncbi:tetratricopeptide repeat protein [Nocardia colli]|uniref:tetratricopeptide repeat protein n=1 Tax=Nocardia colli TaxID=2545717 RepID=UPI0035E0CB8D